MTNAETEVPASAPMEYRSGFPRPGISTYLPPERSAMSHPARPAADAKVCPGCFEPVPSLPRPDVILVAGFLAHEACVATPELFEGFASNVGYTRMEKLGAPPADTVLRAEGREYLLTPSPVAVAVGEVVVLPDGRALHLLDGPPVNGRPGIRWVEVSSPLLALTGEAPHHD